MALNSNTMEFFRRLENNGTGSSKLGKIITTSKTVGSIASGSILSSNITFPAFIDSLFGSGDDMAMDVSPVRLEESSGEYIVDPTIVSHREVDEDGNPVESNFKIKLEVTPGSDLIECINIQKIITTTDPETGDSVSKKITVSTIKTAQASAPSETGVNDFIITVPCTKEDAAADEVKLRVVAYEYIIAPGGPAKPTPLPDEKPSNGQPSKVVEIGVTFGALQLTKAKLTSTQSSPVTNVVTGTSIDFPLTGEVVIGEDGLTMDGIVSLELFENGGSSPVATATDPASGGTVTYTATITADASAPYRKVSVPYTLVATWDDGTTKEATLIPTVVAKEVSSFAKATITVPNPTRTNVISGTSETFNITGSVELGDDGRTRDTLESIKILVDDTEVASSASPATDDATYALSIEASATAPSRTVTKTVKVVATWADGYSSSSSDVVCKVVAKEISSFTTVETAIDNATRTAKIGVAETFAITGTVFIGDDGYKKSELTSLKIVDDTGAEIATATDPTTGAVAVNVPITAVAPIGTTVTKKFKTIAEWGTDTKESTLATASVKSVSTDASKAGVTVSPTSPQSNITHGTAVDYTVTSATYFGDDAKTYASIAKIEILDGSTVLASATSPASSSDEPSATVTLTADTRAAGRKVSKTVTVKVTWNDGTTASTKNTTLEVVAKAPTTETKTTITSSTTSPATAAAGVAVSFPLTGTIAFGDDGYELSEVTSFKLYEGSTEIASATAPFTTTLEKADYKITAGSTVGGTVTKTVKAVAIIGGKTFTSTAVSLAVNTADVTKVNVTSTKTTPQSNIETGSIVSFPVTGKIAIGGDGKTLVDLTSLELFVDDVKDTSASADLSTGTITSNVDITADYGATSHKVAKTVKAVATWTDATTTEGTKTFEVVAKAPEKKIYTGFMMFPYSGCITYDGTKAVPMEDMTDAKWPTPEAIAADIDDSGTGHSTFMPLLISNSGNPDQLIEASMTKHIDPDTLELVDGTTYSAEIFTETRKPSEMRDEIFNNRRPFIIGGGKYSLDSAEVTAMCSASGYVTPVCTEEEKAYIADLVDGDPYDPPSNGEHPSTWGIGRTNYCFVAFPTDDFTLKEMVVAGVDCKKSDYATFDINGVNYTLRHIAGGIAAEPTALLCTVKLERK